MAASSRSSRSISDIQRAPPSYTKEEMRDGVSRRHHSVPKIVVQLPLLVRHHEDLGGVGVELDELAQCPLVSPLGERLPAAPEDEVAEEFG